MHHYIVPTRALAGCLLGAAVLAMVVGDCILLPHNRRRLCPLTYGGPPALAAVLVGGPSGLLSYFVIVRLCRAPRGLRFWAFYQFAAPMGVGAMVVVIYKMTVMSPEDRYRWGATVAFLALVALGGAVIFGAMERLHAQVQRCTEQHESRALLAENVSAA